MAGLLNKLAISTIASVGLAGAQDTQENTTAVDTQQPMVQAISALPFAPRAEKEMEKSDLRVLAISKIYGDFANMFEGGKGEDGRKPFDNFYLDTQQGKNNLTGPYGVLVKDVNHFVRFDILDANGKRMSVDEKKKLYNHYISDKSKIRAAHPSMNLSEDGYYAKRWKERVVLPSAYKLMQEEIHEKLKSGDERLRARYKVGLGDRSIPDGLTTIDMFYNLGEGGAMKCRNYLDGFVKDDSKKMAANVSLRSGNGTHASRTKGKQTLLSLTDFVDKETKPFFDERAKTKSNSELEEGVFLIKLMAKNIERNKNVMKEQSKEHWQYFIETQNRAVALEFGIRTGRIKTEKDLNRADALAIVLNSQLTKPKVLMTERTYDDNAKKMQSTVYFNTIQTTAKDIVTRIDKGELSTAKIISEIERANYGRDASPAYQRQIERVGLLGSFTVEALSMAVKETNPDKVYLALETRQNAGKHNGGSGKTAYARRGGKGSK